MIAEGAKDELAATFEAGAVHVLVGVASGADHATVTALLTAVPDVIEVRESGVDVFEVVGTRDVRADIVRAMTAADLDVMSLTRKGAALDEIYRRYFEGATAP
jgi:sulfite reductase beta subunit-like hemoprotein